MYNLTADPEGLDLFEIDQIENFAERHLDIMDGNPQYTEFLEAVHDKRPSKVQASIEAAKQSSESKVDTFSTYVDLNTSNTNDSQNVHDSAVNEQLRKTFKRLTETTPKAAVERAKQDVKSIQDHISAKLSGADRAKGMKSLSHLLEGTYNNTMNTSEKDILDLVWARSLLPENAANREVIRDAVADSLKDMAGTGGGLVCSNGRCARLLESLVLTDHDDSIVKGVMTAEQIRNEAMKQSNDILHATIEEFSGSAGSPLESVAKSYIDPSIVTSEGEEAKFKKIVTDRVDAVLKAQYASRLSPRDYSNMREHCVTAIESI